MNKITTLLAIFILSITLTGCSNNDTYKVGVSPVPHKEIIEYVRPILEEQGYEFDIIEFTDYVLPNKALDEGEIIVNYFQHIPYLEAQIDEYDYDFTNAGGVHVEPIGIYTKKYASLDALPNTVEFIISNSPTDRPRLFGLLEEAGIITIKDSTTNTDIIDSSLTDLPTLFTSDKTISFIEVDTTLLYTNYSNEEGDAVLINGNYALDNGLNPLEDAIAIEGSASLYVNIITCRTEDIDDPFVKALVEALQSDDVQNWIKEHYEGSVVPAA